MSQVCTTPRLKPGFAVIESPALVSHTAHNTNQSPPRVNNGTLKFYDLQSGFVALCSHLALYSHLYPFLPGQKREKNTEAVFLWGEESKIWKWQHVKNSVVLVSYNLDSQDMWQLLQFQLTLGAGSYRGLPTHVSILLPRNTFYNLLLKNIQDGNLYSVKHQG